MVAIGVAAIPVAIVIASDGPRSAVMIVVAMVPSRPEPGCSHRDHIRDRSSGPVPNKAAIGVARRPFVADAGARRDGGDDGSADSDEDSGLSLRSGGSPSPRMPVSASARRILFIWRFPWVRFELLSKS